MPKPNDDLVLVTFRTPKDMVSIPGMKQISWQFGDEELVRLYYDKRLDGEAIETLCSAAVHAYVAGDDRTHYGVPLQRGGLS